MVLPIRATEGPASGLAAELLRSRAIQALRRSKREADVDAEAPARYLAVSVLAGRTVIEFHDELADAFATILMYPCTAQAQEALFDLGDAGRALRLNTSPRWTLAPGVGSSAQERVALAAVITARHQALPRAARDASDRGRDLLLITELPDAAPTFEFYATRAEARARLAFMHRLPDRFVGLFDLRAGGAELDVRFGLEIAHRGGRVRVRQ